MAKFKIRRSKLSGEICVPPSKSHTHRAILFGMMGKKTSCIRNYLRSVDSEAMIRAVRLFGAKVTEEGPSLLIEGIGRPTVCENVIDAGNSGLVLRLVGGIAALSPHYTIITGDTSIRHQRPMAPLLHGLSQLGAFATSSRSDGYAPIIVRGPLKGGKATLQGADSQPVSALLIASAFGAHKTDIFVDNPGELPWIDMTLYWLNTLGLSCVNDSYTHYTLEGGGSFDHFDKTIPGDMSSAAFPVAAALITGSELTIKNVDRDDVQGDKQLFFALQKMQAQLDFGKDYLHVKPSQLVGCEININAFVDSVTILATLACFATGTTRITGAAIARHKECDRLHAIATELNKMGGKVEEHADGLVITGSPLSGATLATYHDHRMVMSLACAAFGAQGESVIEGVEAAEKTYPHFASEMQRLGAHLEVVT